MAHRFLTDFELLILLAILTVEERASGPAIAREILRAGGCRVVPRKIHAALGPLERSGLVTSAGGDPTSSPRRGAMRIFEVTSAGLQTIKTTQRTLVSLWAGLPELKNEPLLDELLEESGARRSQVWLWYLTTRVQP